MISILFFARMIMNYFLSPLALAFINKNCWNVKNAIIKLNYQLF